MRFGPMKQHLHFKNSFSFLNDNPTTNSITMVKLWGYPTCKDRYFQISNLLVVLPVDKAHVLESTVHWFVNLLGEGSNLDVASCMWLLEVVCGYHMSYHVEKFHM
jgi:hypothetical protein